MSERFTAEYWRNFKRRMREILSEDPDGCECPVCQLNWQEELDRWEELG
jgi:ribosomal protein L37AE/L43A